MATPIAVAKKVMTESPHSLLVGHGAQKFARVQGFTIEPNQSLLPIVPNCGTNSVNDTLSIIAVDKNRNIAAGILTFSEIF